MYICRLYTDCLLKFKTVTKNDFNKLFKILHNFLKKTLEVYSCNLQ